MCKDEFSIHVSLFCNIADVVLPSTPLKSPFLRAVVRKVVGSAVATKEEVGVVIAVYILLANLRILMQLHVIMLLNIIFHFIF